MVAISAAVLSKSGRVLVARQFIPINKTRIEGYLASFPKLISHDNQHTIIDTEHIRYIYQPLENVYVLLITNKNSNIMEDIDTLRLLSKIIPDYCLNVTEESIMAHVFDLIFAFDEVIQCNGYKENITLQQIKTYTEMDSHEEKLQRIIEQTKMDQAKHQMQQKAESIEKQKAEMKKLAALGAATDATKHGRYSSMEGGPSLSSPTHYEDEEEQRVKQQQEREREEKERQQRAAKTSVTTANNPSSAAAGGKKGMQLGKGKKSEDFFTQLNKEDKLPVRSTLPIGTAVSTGGTSSAEPAKTETIRVVIREKLSSELDREGGIKKCEIKGEMKLHIYDPDHNKITLQCDPSQNIESSQHGYKCTLHPKINKNIWSQQKVLSLNDNSKGFPIGSDNAPILLKWRKIGDENDLPFTINFWPNIENNQTHINIEYTLYPDRLYPSANSSNQAENKVSGLSNVSIKIPIGSSDAPEIVSIDGDYKYDLKQKTLTWKLAQITGDNQSGTLECIVNELDQDAFFPIQIDFQSQYCNMSGLSVTQVKSVDGNQDMEFTNDQQLEVEKYTME